MPKDPPDAGSSNISDDSSFSTEVSSDDPTTDQVAKTSTKTETTYDSTSEPPRKKQCIPEGVFIRQLETSFEIDNLMAKQDV